MKDASEKSLTEEREDNGVGYSSPRTLSPQELRGTARGTGRKPDAAGSGLRGLLWTGAHHFTQQTFLHPDWHVRSRHAEMHWGQQGGGPGNWP